MATLESECNAVTIATFDGDTFVDYRARRPTMLLREGINSKIEWPDIELKAGIDHDGHDVLLLTGPEPDMAWRRFAQESAQLASELGVKRMVALGAYPFATPHTRPSRLSLSAPSPEVAARLPLLKNSVDVPAGVMDGEFGLREVKVPKQVSEPQRPEVRLRPRRTAACMKRLSICRRSQGPESAAQSERTAITRRCTFRLVRSRGASECGRSSAKRSTAGFSDESRVGSSSGGRAVGQQRSIAAATVMDVLPDIDDAGEAGARMAKHRCAGA